MKEKYELTEDEVFQIIGQHISNKLAKSVTLNVEIKVERQKPKGERITAIATVVRK